MGRVDHIRSMSPEIITMLGVGVAIVAFLWRTMTGMEQRLDKRIDRLESKVDGLAKDHGSLAGEVVETRGSLSEEIAEIRGSLAGEIAETRGSLAGEIAETRERFIGELAETRASIAGELAEIRERMARLEGLFEGFVRREPPADVPAAE